MKLLALVLMLAMLCGVASADVAIHTCQELQDMNNDTTENYYLANDIDCTGFDFGDGKGFMPIGETEHFVGTFDGRGYKIVSLTMNRPLMNYAGLFSWVDGSSKLENVVLLDVDITARSMTGALLGYSNTWVMVSDSYSTGVIHGAHNTGGLFGDMEGDADRCHSDASVYCTGCACGGLGGRNGGMIRYSYATGDVICDGGTAAGLFGENDANCVESYSTGDVFCSDSAGGLAGELWGKYTNCYSTGNITGYSYLGGAAGYQAGEIYNSYSTGDVSGDSENGGLIGYWDEEIYREYSYYPDNIVCVGCDNNEGETTEANLKSSSWLASNSWDFTNVWTIVEEGTTYPTLRWEYELQGIYEDITCEISPDGTIYSEQSLIGHNLLQMHVLPTSVLTLNVTTCTEPLKRWNESADASAYALYTVGEGDANTTYVVSMYADANGSKMQTFRIKANGTGYIKYNTTGYGYPRWTEIRPATEPPGTLVVISVFGAVLLGGGYVIRRWVKKN